MSTDEPDYTAQKMHMPQGKPQPNVAAVLQRQQMLSLLFTPPSSGSFPLSISWDDVKKALITFLFVGAGAIVTYILNVFLPGLHIDNPMVLWLMPFIVSALQTLERYLRDTRPLEEQQRLPYKTYKHQLKALALLEKEGVNIDPHLPR